MGSIYKPHERTKRGIGAIRANKYLLLIHPSILLRFLCCGLRCSYIEFSRFDLHNCWFKYLNLTFEEGLEHASPITNTLAVLDKRLGKRRLVLINKNQLHPLVKRFQEFRLEAEGLIKA